MVEQLSVRRFGIASATLAVIALLVVMAKHRPQHKVRAIEADTYGLEPAVVIPSYVPALR